MALIFEKVAQSSSSPAEFWPVMTTCRRFQSVVKSPRVLRSLSLDLLACPAHKFCPAYHRTLRNCAASNNVEACYLLGMIEFYCLGQSKEGMKRLVKAGKTGHPAALHSLAIIHFNGSGENLPGKNPSVAVLFCSSAAQKGHVAALRELGHCLQDGNGIAQNLVEGRRLLIEANLREFVDNQMQEIASRQSTGRRPGQVDSEVYKNQLEQVTTILRAIAMSSVQESSANADEEPSAVQTETELDEQLSSSPFRQDTLFRAFYRCLRPIMSDFGCAIPPRHVHPASKFLVEWNAHSVPADGAVKACGNEHCGRTETKQGEFRCCAGCGLPRYCSRGCQAVHWRTRHREECSAVQDQAE